MGQVKGGVHKLQIFGREKYIVFSKNTQPKRAIRAFEGHGVPPGATVDDRKFASG